MEEKAIDIELIALDLDGTLLDPGTRIQPETISVLDQFVAPGRPGRDRYGPAAAAIYRILTDNGVLPGKPYPHALIAEEREIYLREATGSSSRCSLGRRDHRSGKGAASYGLQSPPKSRPS